MAGRPERRWKWWMAAIRMLKDPGRDLLYSPNKEEEVVAEEAVAEEAVEELQKLEVGT